MIGKVLKDENKKYIKMDLKLGFWIGPHVEEAFSGHSNLGPIDRICIAFSVRTISITYSLVP